MFCSNCGAQLAEGSSFCPMCGTKVVETEQMTEAADAAGAQTAGAAANHTPTDNTPTGSTPVGNTAGAAGTVKKSGTKKIGMTAAGAVAAVAVVLTATHVFGGSSANLKVDKDAVTYVNGIFFVDGSYFVDADGSVKEVDDLDHVYRSMDRSTVVYTDDSGDLYLIDEDLKTQRIASDVTTVYVGREGEYVVYLSNEDNDYNNQVLYIYDVSKNKSKEIDSDVYCDYLTISASGKTVAYAKNYAYGDFDTYIGGYSVSAEKIDSKGRKAVAVSDNGKRAYLLGDGNLYYFDGKDSERVAKEVGSSFWTNSDLSELVFTKSGSTYLCRPGKDAEKIDNSAIRYIVYPDGYGTGTLGNYTEALGNDTIKGQVVFTTDDKLFWVNKKADDMVKIDASVDSVTMSADSTSLVYLSNSKLYKVSRLKQDMEPTLLYDEGSICYYAASDDLKQIYGYSDEEDTLYYIKSSTKAVKISDDVDNFSYNERDGKIYFVSDEELYEAKTSSSSKKKVSVDGDVSFVSSGIYGVVAYTLDDGDYTCYYIGDKLIKLN